MVDAESFSYLIKVSILGLVRSVVGSSAMLVDCLAVERLSVLVG